MIVLPDVRSLKPKEGTFDLAGISRGIALCNVRDERITLAANHLIETIRHAIGRDLPLVNVESPETNTILLTISDRTSPAESYELAISPGGIRITGNGPAGLFYGIKTLCQIIGQHGARLPCCEITDSPDFPHRGFYHDVTRGKVPTLATLKSLVEKLSSYKINQLQLYIEHSFAFKQLPDLWYDKDPLTHEEIRELDAWCWMHCIDLVPSLATFGHLYELLRIKRFEHLREVDLPAGGPTPNLWDRMAHHTIDAANPESFRLIKSMLDEFLPLFQSPYCDVCCDETFDLGAGRNRDRAAAAGKGRLYIEFVKKLVTVVREHGKTPMLWGDVIRNYPELLRELPEDLVFLNWGYAPDVTDEAARTFAHHGVRQYVCPGVQGWSRFANNIDAATGNIRAMVRFGREYGAEGVLTTDWGDCGHVNFPAGSYHGMALGAALSWNAASFPDDAAYDAAFSRVAWNDSSGRIVVLLRELGSLCFYHFGNLYAWAYGLEGLWNKETEVKEMEIDDCVVRCRRASAIATALADLRDSGSFTGERIDLDEFICGSHAVRWTLGLLAFKKRYEYNQADCPEAYGSGQRLIEEGRAILGEFEALWRRRNKESELRNVSRTFERVFEKIAELNQNQMLLDG
jgi:hypothetical protein